MTGPYRIDRPNRDPEWFPTEDAALAAEARMRRDGARDVVVWRDDAVYEAPWTREVAPGGDGKGATALGTVRKLLGRQIEETRSA